MIQAPTPVLLLGLILQIPAKAFSLIIVSFTALLYLAMALLPFWCESENRAAQSHILKKSVDQGGSR